MSKTPVLLLCLATATFTPCARGATLDYAAGANLRTLPLGVSLAGVAGFGELLWGENAPSNIQFGFWRASTEISTSGLVNQGELKFELFPISFVRLTGGVGASARFTQIKLGDCTLVACKGGIQRAFAGAQLLLGYDRFFTVTQFRLTSISGPASPHGFSDENSNLIGASGGDTLETLEGAIGAKLDEHYKVGIFVSREKMQQTGFTNNHQSIFMQHASGSWSQYVGAGLYQSDFQARSPTLYGGVKWTGVPALGLR